MGGDDVVHVYPVGDLRDHVIDNHGECWCGPTIQHEPDGTLIIHNSLDGREEYETGKRSLS